MKIEGDDVIFSTGQKRYANCGIIGIDPSLVVHEGYDGHFFDPTEREWRGDDEHVLTPAEQIELADFMIQQWGRFKARAEVSK